MVGKVKLFLKGDQELIRGDKVWGELGGWKINCVGRGMV